MTDSTKSKHYTASDTGTAKNSRWFRSASPRGEIEQLLDFILGREGTAYYGADFTHHRRQPDRRDRFDFWALYIWASTTPF